MRFFRLAWIGILAAACSSDGGGGGDAAPPDAAPEPDVSAACPYPTAALPYEWRPIEQTSAGLVTVESNVGGVVTATIDATAGGSMAFAENPFIYIDLETSSKVAITDVDSYGSPDWDLALKRMVIRVNGGDSGPGGVEAATQFGVTTIEEIGEPAENDYLLDEWATETCDLVSGPLGEPRTSIGEWYDYDVNTHVLTARDQGYVIRRADGTRYKFRIETYYADPGNPMRGAMYRVQWAAF